MSNFQLVTLWQCGLHVVRVEAGPYASAEEARALCSVSLQLDGVARADRLQLHNGRGDTLAIVDDSLVAVFHLTPEILRDFAGSLSLLTDDARYRLVVLPISDFHRYPAFASFYWMAGSISNSAELDAAVPL